jgi:hypothetical protein
MMIYNSLKTKRSYSSARMKRIRKSPIYNFKALNIRLFGKKAKYIQGGGREI